MRDPYEQMRQQMVEDPIQPGTCVDARWYSPRDDRDRHYQ